MHFNQQFIICFLGLLFTWSCKNISGLEGCYRTGGKIESNGSVLTLNSGLLLENSSYFVNVKVIKDQRKAEYTQEVFIAPGDPPEIQIRCSSFRNFFYGKKCTYSRTPVT